MFVVQAATNHHTKWKKESVGVRTEKRWHTPYDSKWGFFSRSKCELWIFAHSLMTTVQPVTFSKIHPVCVSGLVFLCSSAILLLYSLFWAHLIPRDAWNSARICVLYLYTFLLLAYFTHTHTACFKMMWTFKDEILKICAKFYFPTFKMGLLLWTMIFRFLKLFMLALKIGNCRHCTNLFVFVPDFDKNKSANRAALAIQHVMIFVH